MTASIIEALGPDFWAEVAPAKFPSFTLRYKNDRWARRIGLGALDADAWRRHFGELAPLPGNLHRALALAYHGHQFGVYNPYLGDGRGFLFAHVRDGEDGRLLDLSTKGSGTTPFSRGLDGRLTLRGGVREVLASAMLEALGVDTSKALSLYETGERLFRDDEDSPARSALLVRLGHSHLRVGTFQRFAYLRRADLLEALIALALTHYFPGAAGESPAARLMRAVTPRFAVLAASWTFAGFAHGVLNTDNLNITGESFDYGPYKLLATLDRGFVAAYFDHAGEYAFGKQPAALKMGLLRLARALNVAEPEAELDPIIAGFDADYSRAIGAAAIRRLGLASAGEEADIELAQVVLAFLESSAMPFEQLFFDHFGGGARWRESPARSFYERAAFARARELIEAHARSEDAHLDAPYFDRSTPCTLLAPEIDAIWDAIAMEDDWGLFAAKLEAIESMREGLTLRRTAL